MAALLAFSGAMTAHASTVAEPGPAPTLAGTETLQEGDVIAWSPVLGADDWVELGQAETPAAGSTAETEAQPLATTTRAAVSCGSSTSVLEKYSSKYDGTIKLECGSAGGFGLKHILSSHPEQQWRNQMGGPGNVQDFIKYLIRGGLSAPSKKGNVSASNKRCYSTPTMIYEMVNGKPKYKKTINASIFVSVNNKRVVTAIPSTTSRC
jgi:hypothetical protein